MFGDQIREVACLKYVLFDDLCKSLHPVSLQTHPRFQCLEAAREFDTSLSERQAAGNDASGRFGEITCRARKSLAVHLLVTDEDAGDLERQIHPLMQIE